MVRSVYVPGASVTADVASSAHFACCTAGIDGLYHMYYHAAKGDYTDPHGNLPTDIYHAYSSDKINWTVVSPNPILTHLGGSTFEFDQAADPYIVESGGQCWMYYTGENNVTYHASIGLAIADATLEEIIAGTG